MSKKTVKVLLKNKKNRDAGFVSSIYESERKKIAQCNIRDIAYRKQAEEKIKKMSEELARSNKDLAQFAYFASHDLQEPLRTMTDFFTLLEKKCKGKIDIESADFIKYSMEAASRLKALVSNLLTYSQVDASNRTFETTDFGELLEDVTDNLKTVIEETGAEIMHDPLPVLNADSIQIMQLFQNLIGNALKFRRGRPVVRVSAVRKDNEWFFSVKDNGIGLDMKYADSIFNSFQRLHSMKEYPGTGLGLAICKKIVERHGGRIWLDSKPGDGTVFYFTIPVSPPVRAAETVMPRQPESDGEKR